MYHFGQEKTVLIKQKPQEAPLDVDTINNSLASFESFAVVCLIIKEFNRFLT